MKFNWGIFIVAFTSPSILTSLPVPDKQTNRQTYSCHSAWYWPGDEQYLVPPDMILYIQAKEFNLSTIRPDNLVLVVWESFRYLLKYSRLALICILLLNGFLVALPYRSDLRRKWLSSRVLLFDAGALWEWPLGCWSPPSPRPFHHSHWLSGQFSEESWWTSSI